MAKGRRRLIVVEDETWDWFKGFAETYQIKGYRNRFSVQETLTVIRQILERAGTAD